NLHPGEQTGVLAAIHLAHGRRRSDDRVAHGAGVWTRSSSRDGRAVVWNTRIVAGLKSSGFASKIFGTNVCGLRSFSGNHELCTCTMMRCPFLNVWLMSGIE